MQTLDQSLLSPIQMTDRFLIVPKGIANVPPDGVLTSILLAKPLAFTTRLVFVETQEGKFKRQFNRDSSKESQDGPTLLVRATPYLVQLYDELRMLQIGKTAIAPDRLLDFKTRLMEVMPCA